MKTDREGGGYKKGVYLQLILSTSDGCATSYTRLILISRVRQITVYLVEGVMCFIIILFALYFFFSILFHNTTAVFIQGVFFTSFIRMSNTQ